MRAFRTPQDLASRWEVTQVAFLNDIASKGLPVRVDSRQETGTHASVTLLAMPTPFRKESQTKYSIGWRVLDLGGDSPSLESVWNADTINLDGTPTVYTPHFGDTAKGPIRPYADLLFKEGLITVSTIATENDASPSSVFDFGIVLGLVVVVSSTETYPAWTPIEKL